VEALWYSILPKYFDRFDGSDEDKKLLKEMFFDSRKFILTDSYLRCPKKVDVNDVVEGPLSLPFDTCFFQGITNEPLGVTRKHGDPIVCFLIRESSPGQFISFVYGGNNDTKKFAWYMEKSSDRSGIKKGVQAILMHMQEIGCEWGVERVGLRGKIRVNGKNEHYKINNVIHVVPKQAKKEYAHLNQTIDWSHRWEVRGHWRKISTIGRDRSGQYVIPGYTWVKDFVKGPEEKQLVKKIRVFKEGAHADMRS
jgi:hypothetical protein